MFSTSAKPVPTAKPKIAASTRKPMRWARISATMTRPFSSLLDDRRDVAGEVGQVEAEERERPGVHQVARARHHGAARDDRDDGVELHELVAVEIEQRGEEASHRQQADQRGQHDIERHDRARAPYMILSETIHSVPARFGPWKPTA